MKTWDLSNFVLDRVDDVNPIEVNQFGSRETDDTVELQN